MLKPLCGSLLEKAVGYAAGHRELLGGYMLDGRSEISNNRANAKANHLNVFQYLYTLRLYMPDYKNEPAGVEAMMPWSDFIKERCCGVMDTEAETPENRGRIPWQYTE